MERELLTIPQAAERVGLTRAVMWRHVKEGHLPSIKVSDRLRLIDAEELDLWHRKRRRKPGRPRAQKPVEYRTPTHPVRLVAEVHATYDA